MLEDSNREPGAAETRAILLRAKAGDREALEAAFLRIRPRFEKWVATRVGPHLRARLDVEDIAQETLLRAFEALPRYEPKGEGAFFAWIMKIAEHRIADANDYFKARKRSSEREQRLEESLRASMTSPFTGAGRRENHERLLEALAGLSEPHRQVIRLVRLEERSYAEAAAMMGKTEGAVSQLLVRALAAIRTRLEALRPSLRWRP